MTEPLPEAADSENLTSALRRCGALSDGRVSAVAVESTRATILSKIVRLRLSYDRPGAGAPGTLIFKSGLPERLTRAWNGGRQEVAFYTEIASAMPAGMVPRCFEAEWDEDTKHWRLLLEDLTDFIRSRRHGPCRRRASSASRSSGPGRASTRIGGTTHASAYR